MEFTPKKGKFIKSGLRNNPYTSGGQKYLHNYKAKRFHNNGSLPYTPRNYGKNGSQGTYKFKPRSLSRADNILQNSQALDLQKENVPVVQNGVNPDPQDSNKDVILSDSDDERQSFKWSMHGDNKENNFVARSTLKVYPRKSTPVLKSKIAHDISPAKIDDAYMKKDSFYSSKSHLSNNKRKLEEKENISENSLFPTKIKVPYLMGFPNYGNTCYLNAVLQALVGLNSFCQDLGNAMKSSNISTDSISYSLWNFILNRQKCELSATKRSLRCIKENFEKHDCSFSGYKMQDANEFLICMLDAIKDEIDKICSQQTPSSSNSTNLRRVIGVKDCIPETPEKFTPNGNILPPGENSASKSDHIDEKNKSVFDIPSQCSDSSLEVKPISKNHELPVEDDDFEVSFKKNSKSVLDSPDDIFKNVVKSSQDLLATYLVTPAKSSSDEENAPAPAINPVKHNFGFELLESYTCLGCNHIVERIQHHFALYVNLPEDGRESIQEAVEAYTSEDHRDLTCEKCGHETSSVITTFSKFPRILIVQMKRYEYKTDLLECTKVSSKVDINLWLHLQKFSSNNFKHPPEWTALSNLLCSAEKPSTLSVRNLSSDLNICEKNPPSENNSDIKHSPEKEIISNEDENLQEAMRRSIEDQGGVQQSDNDKEEEELQRAIQLSLQEIGMTNTFNDFKNENEGNLGLEVNGEECCGGEDEKNEPEGPLSYRLLSVISHFGLTTSTGHYVADLYNCKESCWYHYDDESVTKVPNNIWLGDGRKKNGYIFFYVHNEVFKQMCN